MNRFKITYCSLLFTIVSMLTGPQVIFGQSLSFNGQAIGWTTLNPAEPFQAQVGLRYIPELSS